MKVSYLLCRYYPIAFYPFLMASVVGYHPEVWCVKAAIPVHVGVALCVSIVLASPASVLIPPWISKYLLKVSTLLLFVKADGDLSFTLSSGSDHTRPCIHREEPIHPRPPPRMLWRSNCRVNMVLRCRTQQSVSIAFFLILLLIYTIPAIAVNTDLQGSSGCERYISSKGGLSGNQRFGLLFVSSLPPSRSTSSLTLLFSSVLCYSTSYSCSSFLSYVPSSSTLDWSLLTRWVTALHTRPPRPWLSRSILPSTRSRDVRSTYHAELFSHGDILQVCLTTIPLVFLPVTQRGAISQSRCKILPHRSSLCVYHPSNTRTSSILLLFIHFCPNLDGVVMSDDPPFTGLSLKDVRLWDLHRIWLHS